MLSTTKNILNMPTIKVDATAKDMTTNAGLIPVLKFLTRLMLGKMISETVSTVERAPNAKYSFAGIMEMVICAQIAGASAIEHVSKICGDKIISRCAGWELVPDATTIGRVIKVACERNIHEIESVNADMRDKVWKHLVRSGHKLACAMSNMVIDMDSTVQGVYGKQEGAEKGYNPHKKGQLAYHPLMAFCAETKEVLHSWYRCGSAYTSNGAVEFLKELMAKLNPGVNYFLRADSGFFDGDLLTYLESICAGYLIKVKIKNLNKLLQTQIWTKPKYNSKYEETVFTYKCNSWKKERTLVAIRFQTGVSDDMYKTPTYDYFCYVTTITNMTPFEIHKYYGKRATSETWIEEFKSQMGAGQIRTGEFIANSALFQCGVMGYNILKWMAIFAGAKLQKWEVKSIRLWLIRVAGKLTVSGGQLTLKVPENFLNREYWDMWEKITHELSFN